MFRGVVVGLVTDNKDPEGLHRVKVKYPVETDSPSSSWVRVASPMAGKGRGLVILPDIDTEVLIAFGGRGAEPYVLGGLYNGGEDTPDTYANEDGNDDHRRFWSRGSHWLDFDDTSGDEHVRLTCTSESKAIEQDLDATNKTVTIKIAKDFKWEAVERITLKCKDFSLKTDSGAKASAGDALVFASSSSADVKASGTLTLKGSTVDLNQGSGGSTTSAPSAPSAKHPPEH
jgi:uncharacterized protein involved in type VI secretion and phage assembly